MTLTGRTVQLDVERASPVGAAFVRQLGRWVRFGEGATANRLVVDGLSITLITTNGHFAVSLPEPWFDVDGYQPVAPHVRARRRAAAFRPWPAVLPVDHVDIALAAVGWSDEADDATVVRAMALGTLVVGPMPCAVADTVVGTWRDALDLADDVERQGFASSVASMAMHERYGLVWRTGGLMEQAGWTSHPVAAIERERARLHDARPTRVAARHHLLVGGWRS
jgi:hypothetical protein